MTRNIIRRAKPIPRPHSYSTTEPGSVQAKHLLDSNDELDLASVQIIKLAEKCGHHEVHPVHIAFALLYREKDIIYAPQRSIPARPILDIPLLWTMLVEINHDPNEFGERLRSELVKLDLEGSSDANSTQASTLQVPDYILNIASRYALKKGDKFLAIHHVLLAIFDDPTIQRLVGTHETRVQLIEVLERFCSERIMVFFTRPKYLYLRMFADDLTEIADANGVDPVICRDDEIRRLLCIMSRRGKRNALLLGEPGVGKTAIIEGLAQNIVSRMVPLTLNGRVFSLDLARLLAGTSCKGVYERRVETLLAEIERNEDAGNKIFLFIGNFHLVVTGKRTGGEGGIDAANLFKPILARGKIHCIGATTPEEYERCILLDSSLERRFSKIYVDEPSSFQARTILRGIRDRYENHHNLHIEDKALTTAVDMAKRYNTRRRLPDSAIDIVDEACSRLYIANETCSHDIWLRENELKKLKVDATSLKKEGDFQSRLISKELEQKAEIIKQGLRAEYLARATQYREVKELEDEINKMKTKLRDLRSRTEFTEARKHELDINRKSEICARRKLELDQVNKIGKTEIRAVLPMSLWRSEFSYKEQKLRELQSTLSHKVVGQHEALTALIRPVQLTSMDLENPSYPLASLLLVGPSGCGKTLAVRTLAHSLFDSFDHLITIDGNSYCDNLSITRLIGTPITCAESFDMAGELTEFVKRTPCAIILVNQADKLCSEIKSMFAQILDHGQLNDGNGDAINFRNCFIFFTATLPDSESSKAGEEDEPRDLLQDMFSTEFINRLDGVVHFRKLSSQDLKEIFELRLQELRLLLEKRGIDLSISMETQQRLWTNIQKRVVLARDVDHSIQTGLVSSISILLLRQPGSPGLRMRMIVEVGHDEGIVVDLVEDAGDGAD